MNHAVMWRLLWKEYRQQRAVWISVLGLTVGTLLLVIAGAAVQQESLSSFTLLLIALVAPAVYASGCGATLFAAEHEAETFAFHQALPVSVNQLFWTKVFFAAASTVCLAPPLCLFAAMLPSDDYLQAYEYGELVAAATVATFEVLVWAVFFSLVLKRPLWAAVLAFAVASFGVHVLQPLLGYDTWSATGGAFVAYYRGFPIRLALASAVLLVDWQLGREWFRDRAKWHPNRLMSPIIAKPLAATRPLRLGGLARPWWRLIWLELRQSWPLLATLSGIYALASGWYAIRFGHQGLEPIVVMLVVLGALHGGCVFLGDKQGDRYRFFAEHGIKPGQVWITRQTVWIAALACWTLLTTAVGTYMVFDHTPNDSNVYVALSLGLTPLLAYTVGQLCSTFFRSGILANTIGIPAAALLCGWALLMFVFQVNPALSVAPLPLALLLATRLRANDWIVERFVWRARVRAAASVVLPVGLVFAAVIWLRVAEYPNEGPGFDVQEFARPITAKERATADLYREAWSSLGPLSHESETALSPLVGPTQAREADRETQGSRSTYPKGAPEPSEENATNELNGETQPEMMLSTMEVWVDKHQDELQIALQASQMRDCVFGKLTGHFNQEEVLRSARLGALFYWSGRIREEQGDPDKAFESYLAALRYAKHLRVRATVWDAGTAHILERVVLARLPQWVSQSDMTSQQVLLARSQIDEVLDTMPNKSEAYKASYLIAKQTLTDDDRYAQVVFESIPNRTRAMALLILKRLMPWEIVRARRVMDSVVREELEQWQANRVAIDRMPPTLFASSPHINTAMRTTPVLWEIFEPYELRLIDGLGGEREQTARRRATHLVLALQAAYIDKGDLPATLDELTGDYVDEIPLDPYVGQPFRYFPKGVSFSLSYRAFNTMDLTYPTSVLPGQAFVWSVQNSIQAVRSSAADRKEETDDEEYLRLGRAFPIPTHADGP